MNNNETQKIWQELDENLFCCRCKAGKLLLWEKPAYGEVTNASKYKDGKHFYSIICEYFKRTVPNPLELKRCGAFQKK